MAPSGLRRPNDPPLLILVSLADGPKHGHALAKDIEDFAGVRLGPGALYGAITRLVEHGLIEPLGSDDRRRPYRITPPRSGTGSRGRRERPWRPEAGWLAWSSSRDHSHLPSWTPRGPTRPVS
jgi:hypothetical protein